LVIEFRNHETEKLQTRIARVFGYEFIGHRTELHGRPIKAGRKDG